MFEGRDTPFDVRPQGEVGLALIGQKLFEIPDI
jgi:hypothetical protein